MSAINNMPSCTIGFLLLVAASVNFLKAETCEDFVKPTVSPSCIPVTKQPNCILKYGDLNCGPGVQLVYFKNCESQLQNCCQPCSRKVIPETGCTADYCIYGNYPPGLVYNVGECEYISDRWSDCHAEILIRKRVDPLLVSPTSNHCSKLNIIERACNANEVNPDGSSKPVPISRYQRLSTPSPSLADTKKVVRVPGYLSKWLNSSSAETEGSPEVFCSYSTVSTWSSCHHETQTRQLVRKLDSDSDQEKCEDTKVEIRPCFSKGGKERCFYTKWSRWSKCENFIQQRKRDILFGKKGDCTRTVRIRSCQPESENHRHSRRKLKRQRIH